MSSGSEMNSSTSSREELLQEVKSAREKEQENARELENLKVKLQKEKAQELQVGLLGLHGIYT